MIQRIHPSNDLVVHKINATNNINVATSLVQVPELRLIVFNILQACMSQHLICKHQDMPQNKLSPTQY